MCVVLYMRNPKRIWFHQMKRKAQWIKIYVYEQQVLNRRILVWFWDLIWRLAPLLHINMWICKWIWRRIEPASTKSQGRWVDTQFIQCLVLKCSRKHAAIIIQNKGFFQRGIRGECVAYYGLISKHVKNREEEIISFACRHLAGVFVNISLGCKHSLTTCALQRADSRCSGC